MPSSGKIIAVCVIFAICYYAMVTMYAGWYAEANNGSLPPGMEKIGGFSERGAKSTETVGTYWSEIIILDQYPEDLKKMARTDGGIIGYINRQEGGRVYVVGQGEVWVLRQGDNPAVPNYFLLESDLTGIEKIESVDQIYVYIPPLEQNKNAILHTRAEFAMPSSAYNDEKYARGETDKFAQGMQNIVDRISKARAYITYDFGVSNALGLPEEFGFGKIVALIWSTLLVVELWMLIPDPAGGTVSSLIGMGLKYGLGAVFLGFILI